MLTIVGQLAELTAQTGGNVILDGLHRARRRLAEFVDLRPMRARVSRPLSGASNNATPAPTIRPAPR